MTVVSLKPASPILAMPTSWDGRQLNIVVIGAGGNGSEVIDCLSSFHYAMLALGHKHGLHVTVIDDAVVREPNLVRQRFWPCDLGQFKSIALVNRYNLMQGCSWEALPFRFPSPQVADAIEKAHIVISAVDLPSVRVAIANYKGLIRGDALWLDLGNGQRHGQVVFGALNPAKRKTYPCVLDAYPEIAELIDDNSKSCSTAASLGSQDCLVNRTVTTAGMNIIWELLRKGATSKHWIVLSLETGEQMTYPFPPI